MVRAWSASIFCEKISKSSKFDFLRAFPIFKKPLRDQKILGHFGILKDLKTLKVVN